MAEIAVDQLHPNFRLHNSTVIVHNNGTFFSVCTVCVGTGMRNGPEEFCGWLVDGRSSRSLMWDSAIVSWMGAFNVWTEFIQDR